jgi:hypothetical protein
MVRILRIIEHEEEFDEQKQREKQLEELSETTETKSRSPKEIRIRGYKKKLLDSIAAKTNDVFEETLQDKGSVKEMLDAITELFEDHVLDKIPNYVEPCFPPTYDIVNYYNSCYENQLVKFVQDMLDKRHKLYADIPMAEKLRLVKWLNEYPEFIEDAIEKPHNFSKDCEIIVGEYVAARTTKMIEIVSNIANQDCNMKPNDIQLNRSAKGYPYTPAPVDLFSVLNIHIDEVVRSGIKNVSCSKLYLC